MALMTLNAEIMAFGYSGMLASHRRDQGSPRGALCTALADGDDGADHAAPPRPMLVIRSLLVRLRNPRS